MKKFDIKNFLLGIVVGALLLVGSSIAYAEVSSLIGKTVDGQVPLIINGEVSDNPAITVEGVSYIPLRAAGAIFGYDVAWIDGEVVMEEIQADKAGVPSAEELAERARLEEEQMNQELIEQAARIEAESKVRREREAQIGSLQLQIRNLRTEIENREANKDKRPKFISPGVLYEGSDLQKKHIADLEQLKADLADLEQQLADLEAEKAALEAQQTE